MNILHLGKYYPPFHGGMEHYLQDLAEEQVKQGHNVTVLVHNHQHGSLLSKTQTEAINGVQVTRLKSTRPIFFTPLMLSMNKTINDIIEAEKIDIIHLHWPNPSLAFLLWNSRAKNIPWIIRWHADMVTESSSWILKCIYRLIRPIEQAIINRCQLILCSSPNYIQHSPALQKNKDKCRVLPLGIADLQHEEQQSNQLWAEQKWPEGKLRIFNLGRLTFYKNQKLLIDAAQHNPHHTLIAGTGQLRSTLQAQIDQNNSPNIELIGCIDWQQVNALYQSCDVFCLPSHDRAESFGVVLLEAMWHNKIILVADTQGSGMSWLAEQYNKGFTFKSNDSQDMNKQLTFIQQNLQEVKQKPKDFKWSIELTAEQLNQFYQSIKKEES